MKRREFLRTGAVLAAGGAGVVRRSLTERSSAGSAGGLRPCGWDA